MASRVIAVLALAMAAVAMTGCGGDGDDGDDVLALGETAVIEYTPTTSSGAPGNPTMLGITVTAVRRGTQDELAEGGLEVDAEDQNATPYYIDARYENRGQKPVERAIDVSVEGPDGETLPSTVVFNFGGRPFKPCRNVSEGTLAQGESFEDCTLVLVPGGDEADTVLFVSQKANNEIVFTRWDASGS
jgi:hypothetical protein